MLAGHSGAWQGRRSVEQLAHERRGVVPLHVAGIPYLVAAVLLGSWILALSVRGFETGTTHKSARQLFYASIIYIPALFTALALDALV